MRNLQMNDTQKIKGYLLNAQGRVAFWYTEEETRNISENFGQPVADGERLLITQSPLDFQINQRVLVGGEELRIQDIRKKLLPNLNSLRGAAAYEKTLVVR